MNAKKVDFNLFGKGSPDFSKIHSPIEYSLMAEKIKKKFSNKSKQKNIVILSSYTSEILRDYLYVELAKRSLNCKLTFLPFNQLEQEIFNEKSKIYNKKTDMILLLFLIEDFVNLNKVNSKQLMSKATKLIRTIRQKSSAKIFISNFFERHEHSCGDLYFNNYNDTITILNFNKLFLRFIKTMNDVFLLDFRSLIFDFGIKNIFEKKLEYIAKVPFSSGGQVSISKLIARCIATSYKPTSKCLVLDADNTLWGGVVGELGKDNIQLSESYPGNTFKDFQRYILKLHKRGIILALASKNNFEDVREVFSKNDDALLKLKHFSSIQVNWDEKFINLQKISTELNIGLDSLVFFDDSPFERELIRNKLPSVNIIDVPNDSSKYIQVLEDSEYFDTYSISSEDKKRNLIYRQEKKRKVLRDSSKDIDAFLKNLDMTAKFYKLSSKDLSRAVQLLSKTNQFNLTTKRHSESNLVSFLNKGGLGYTMRIADCFGDNGVVGLILIKKTQSRWHIDSLLLSCRVIGRKAEDLLLSYALNSLFKIEKKTTIEVSGEYIKTERNSLVKDFFKQRGFSLKNNLLYKKLSKKMLMPKFFKLIN